jgi:hypothetical protein
MGRLRPAFFSPSVNPYTRVAQAVIRLIAFALVVISFLLYISDHVSQYEFAGLSLPPQPPPRRGRLAWQAIPFLIGLILFWKSRALADRLTKDLD